MSEDTAKEWKPSEDTLIKVIGAIKVALDKNEEMIRGLENDLAMIMADRSVPPPKDVVGKKEPGACLVIRLSQLLNRIKYHTERLYHIRNNVCIGEDTPELPSAKAATGTLPIRNDTYSIDRGSTTGKNDTCSIEYGYKLRPAHEAQE